jgi:proline dehydrogenase
MFRSFLTYLSKAGWARQMVMRMPVARQAASRFYAGETLKDAVRVIRELNTGGILATLDHLGEHTTNSQEAVNATREIVGMIDAVNDAGIQSNVSIKLSQIGMTLDETLCRENLASILMYARERAMFVRVDMEDTPWVDFTLRLYREMRCRGLNNVGVVIQACLYRSQADIEALVGERSRVRLCKGAYLEPAELAYPKKKDTDANYDHLVEILLDGAKAAGAPQVSKDGKIPPLTALATHDLQRIEHGKEYARKIGLPREAVEFQMLYGIRRDLQESLAKEGYPVRVYVPYGLQWYPYYMRRLAERPANVWFFISNYFRR